MHTATKKDRKRERDGEREGATEVSDQGRESPHEHKQLEN